MGDYLPMLMRQVSSNFTAARQRSITMKTRKLWLILLSKWHPNCMVRSYAELDLMDMMRIYIVPCVVYRLMYMCAMGGLRYKALYKACDWLIHRIPMNVRFELS